jgi:stage IV sporulation protein FB
MASLYYDFNISKIRLYPFGGNITFEDKINRPLKQEFVVLISGPMFQIFYYLMLSIINYIGLINPYTFNMITNYHYSLLLFNLLPIYPLDGSKYFNVILSKFISFKKAHKIMLYMSFATIMIILYYLKYISIGVNMYLIIVILIFKLANEMNNHNNIFNKFLLERYLGNFDFNKLKIIKGIDLSKMMRDKRHIFIFNDNNLTEKQLLKKRYNKSDL